MFFGRNNDIDDDYEKKPVKKVDKKNILSNYKLPIMILMVTALIIIIILIVNMFSNKNNTITYDDKLYYISLIGEDNITLYLGEVYNEPGYIGKDDNGNDLTDQVAVTNNVDTGKIGDYKIAYTLGDITKERKVKVIEKPVGATYIHLFGDINLFLYVGDEYVEDGYEVIDTVDGSKLKDKVTITSNVDTSKEGIYKVIYSVKNTSGITTSKERTVVVMNRDISLLSSNTNITNGNITINIYVKDELFDYLILPNNSKISERTATYEVSSNGTYKFVMFNTKGESIEKSITISNIDKESPSGSCSGIYQNGISQININAKDNIGISRYAINGQLYTTNTIRIKGEFDSVNVTIYDKANNNKTIGCKLENKNSSGTSTPQTPTPSQPVGKVPLNVPSGTNERSDYDSEMRYLEVMPSNATTNMPLLIYMDGAYTYSSFPARQLGRSITKYVENGGAYNEVGEIFLYISPRYVINNGSDGRLNWDGSNGARETTKLKGLIDFLYQKYKIDMNRIYITGVSLGGDGVWHMINAYPNLFAAGTAVSGCPFSATANNFKTTPVLGYNGTGPTERSAGYTSCVPGMVKKINSAGGIAESRVKRGWDHNSMVNVYVEDEDVLKWMFKYKRG